MIQDIIKKQSLENLNIVGGVLVSRVGETLNLTIENLLLWCNWILIMLDNEDENTLNVVNNLKKKFPNRIKIERSGFKRLEKINENKPGILLQRFKRLQGPIRETIFKYMREEDKKKKIDILIYPDSDEIFSNFFEKLLLDFWNMKDKQGIKMRCVWPFGDFKTIGKTKMCSHVRVFKFNPKITTYPWRHDWLRNPTPFNSKELLRNENILIHNSHLLDSMIKWRTTLWRSFPSLSIPLWSLNKDIREMSSEEIKNKLNKAPDLTIGEYLKKYGKNFTN
jgi:hypothetical protein